MSLLQAVLLGAIYWINSSEMYVPFTYTFFDSPLVMSLWVGLILGDVPTAVAVGATIMVIYLSLVAVGGSYPVDKAAAGIIPAAMAVTLGLSIGQAVVVAAFFAILLTHLYTLKRRAMVWTVHEADRCVERGDTGGIYRTVFIWANLIRFVIFFIPMTLILYFATPLIGDLFALSPLWLNNAFSVIGGLMPALGITMVIIIIGHGEMIPFFVAGYLITAYAGLSNMQVALLALFLGWLYLLFTKPADGKLIGSLADITKAGERDMPERRLDKGTLRRAFHLWRYTSCEVDNIERLQALAMCTTMVPVLKTLYPDRPEEIKSGLKRHMAFFISENLFGAIIPGIVASMEEERANGASISDDAINGLKTGLMGPIAGIGDTLNYSTFWPLLQAFFIPYGLQGHWWAAILPGLLGYLLLTQEGQFMWNLGYRMGSKAALAILQSNIVNRVLLFMSVYGLIFLGGLAARVIKIQTGIEIPIGGQMISLQGGILDAVIPGALSLLMILGIYQFFKKGGTVIKATLLILAVGLVLGGLGILAVPAL